MTLVVDVANVLGSRPDGWWRDRAGATTRLLAALAALVGRQVVAPDGAVVVLGQVVAVVEGAARAAIDPAVPGLVVEAAPQDGDGWIVRLVEHGRAAGADLLVVTADRGLRARLPGQVGSTGPRWLLDQL
ncbi:MAG: hypothetical protein KJ792_05270 [Actinobacteria bacterium]|nr:hypothetical protein [Actinomycetota bacterium]